MGNSHDLLVIGSGPGGYVAAIRAAQLGQNVACIEKEKALGGTCLRVGCIPSKALLEASEHYHNARHGLDRFGIKVGDVELDLGKMMKHKDRTVRALTQGVAGLFKKNKVQRYLGHGRIVGPGRVVVEGDETTEVEAKNILIATGSEVTPLPAVEVDGEYICTSTEALSFAEVPQHLVVIGAGVIGLELGSVWARLGARVTVLEYMDRILPGIDGEVAKQAQRVFKKQGLDFELGVRVVGAHRAGNGCEVLVEDRDPITCDRVLMAVGRRPFTAGLGLENVGIELDKRGRIPVDESFKTSADGVYAIGDVIPGPMLAHKAEHEGIACVEQLFTGHGHVNYDAIPNVVYTHPEIAGVGKTEEELKEAGERYRKGTFPFMANGRAKAMAATEGLVKILADAETDRVRGVHILGARAGELIAEAAVSIEFGASSEDIARSVHAHPTLSEGVKEAALAVDERTINF